MYLMNNDQREIRRKLCILEHADKIGSVQSRCLHYRKGAA